MNVRAGTLLNNGKYAIEAPLGQGYFGATYRATHGQLWQPVILKTLGDTLLNHPNRNEFARQFVEQARLLARCQHPNLPRVLDLFDEQGQVFLVLEYVSGNSLLERVNSQRPLSPQEALTVIQQVANAVEALHQQGLLHRDIKPEHILQVPGGDRLVLIEIGLTRDLTTGAGQTYSGLLSPGYAAPEQYNGAPSSPATDVYALAATAYYLLSGQPPASAPLRDRVPLKSLDDGSPLGAALEEAILTGLDLNPQTRPRSLRDWLAVLPDATRASSGASRPRPSTPQGPAPTATEAAPARPIFQRPWVPALFATTSVVAAIGGAAAMMSLRSAMSRVPESDPSQLLQSDPSREGSPRLRQTPDSSRPRNGEAPLLEIDAWTPVEPSGDGEYTRNRWSDPQPESRDRSSSWSGPSATPQSQNYSNRDPYPEPHEPREYPAEPETYEAPYSEDLDPYDDPLLTDKPFTGNERLDVPSWSEPVPESLERPWGSEPDWGANPEAKVPDSVQEDPWQRQYEKQMPRTRSTQS
ncbi:serine/threonine protein kinase [Geitlerinema sp. P-1104]|uniref:serine/threonine protein kinase n=1 Tax=Geitlerinema sp. P-1104 TaxID=2546230 RepID=UPI0014769A72|nr:serine/threonine protein kinase [Geitlerinema sp. P-1104]NMG58787.1 serine/threonine protein kinase [Geitlerinema sp. P-1104]